MRQQEVTQLESGQVITHHAAEDCSAFVVEGPRTFCPLHKPEPGPWANWPRHWDSDKQIVVRMCPCGIYHPAQEVYDWSMERGQAWKLVHYCCQHPHQHVCSRRVVTAQMALANAEAFQIGQIVLEDVSLADLFQEAMNPSPNLGSGDRLALIRDALDLVVELWPSQGRVKMGKETWDRLRRVLLAVPELVTELEATNE